MISKIRVQYHLDSLGRFLVFAAGEAVEHVQLIFCSHHVFVLAEMNDQFDLNYQAVK